MKVKTHWFIIITAAVAATFIYYCEKLQLLPLTTKGLYGRLSVFFTLAFILFGSLVYLFQKAAGKITGREWVPILCAATVLSVCIMVWFPIPNTGIFEKHRLDVRALHDENGEFRPVTMTWLHREDRDIPLSDVHCEGNCRIGEYGPTLMDDRANLYWYGKTGNMITIEFLAGNGQGIVEFQWDGSDHKADLNNSDFSRLSFDRNFAAPDAFPEFLAVWLISLLLSIFVIAVVIKLLPSWNFISFYSVVFILYVIFRVLQTRTIIAPPDFVDSEFYLGQSRFTVSEILHGVKYCRISEWHCLSRPVLIALVYKLCSQDTNTIIWTQAIISILSWGYFAYHAAGLGNSDISRKLILILSLGLGTIPNVTCWDGAIMSESLSISASMFLTGSLFYLTVSVHDGNWHIVPAVCTGFSALLFVNTRDSAMWTVLFILITLIAVAYLRTNKRVVFSLAAFLAFVCLLCAGNTGDRWVYSYENVLFNRILRDPGGEQFFIDSGMPTPSGLREFYGVEHAMIYPKFNSEEFTPFREWIITDGLKTYVRYLMRTPMESLRTAWHQVFEKEAFENISYKFKPIGFKQLLPDTVIRFFSCNIPGIMMIVLALTGMFPLFLSKNGERYVFPVLFVLTAYLLALAAFLSDECDTDRHMFGMIIMMKAAAWPLIVMLCEDLKNQCKRSDHAQTDSVS